MYAGVSQFDKPIIPQHKPLLPAIKQTEIQANTLAEIKIIFNHPLANIQLGYFFTQIKNSIVFYDEYFFSLYSGDISSADLKDSKLQGVNLNFKFNVWKININSNSSIYFSKKDFGNFNYDVYKLPEYSSTGGIYFIDTLFNNNLKLKAGLNYSYVGSRGFYRTDFERLISSNHEFIIETADVHPPFVFPTFSPSFQVDFFLAGKIQNSATVYFIFENLLNAKYFIVPYYPKQARGIRFGVAWNFLD